MKKNFTIIILFIATFLVMSSCNFFTKKKDAYIKQLEQVIKEDSLKRVAEIESLKAEMQAKLDSMKQACGNCEGNFYVITGSFKIQQNADNYLNEMKSLGYNAQIVEAPNGFHLVSTFCGKTLNESLNALNTARNNVHPEAWIYIKY